MEPPGVLFHSLIEDKGPVLSAILVPFDSNRFMLCPSYVILSKVVPCPFPSCYRSRGRNSCAGSQICHCPPCLNCYLPGVLTDHLPAPPATPGSYDNRAVRPGDAGAPPDSVSCSQTEIQARASTCRPGPTAVARDPALAASSPPQRSESDISVSGRLAGNVFANVAPICSSFRNSPLLEACPHPHQ